MILGDVTLRNCKRGREHTKMQWNLQNKVNLKHVQCCQRLVKWSAALVLLLIVVIAKPLGRCVPFDILYFTLRNIRTFQFLDHGFTCFSVVGQILLRTGEFSFIFFIILFIVFFPIGDA